MSRSIQIAACAFVCETTRNRGLHGAPSAFVKMNWWVRPRVVHLIQSWHTPCTHTHSPCACLPPLSSEIQKNLSRAHRPRAYVPGRRSGGRDGRTANCGRPPSRLRASVLTLRSELGSADAVPRSLVPRAPLSVRLGLGLSWSGLLSRSLLRRCRGLLRRSLLRRSRLTARRRRHLRPFGLNLGLGVF